MLSYAQRKHFSEKGWVLLEDVFNADQVSAYIAAMDRAWAMRRCLHTSEWTEEIVVLDNLVYFDQVFLEWLAVPGLIEANAQIMGSRVRFEAVFSHIKQPHKERHTRAEEFSNPDRWGWHRDLRPKWGVFPADDDPALINALLLNNVTYLTDVSPGNGSTAFLNGSHRLEGGYQSLKDRCEVEVPAVRAGGVVIFTESLIHAAVPILSENVRYNMYYNFSPPWFRCWKYMHLSEALVSRIADENIRTVFDQPSYAGQFPEQCVSVS